MLMEKVIHPSAIFVDNTWSPKGLKKGGED